MKLKLEFSGDAKQGIDYDIPTEITFPKGEIETFVEFKILGADDLESVAGGRNLIIKIAPNDKLVTGVQPQVRIKIEGGMPTTWVGHDSDHAYAFSLFTPCTKARYQFFFDTFDFYDFSTVTGYDTPSLSYSVFRFSLGAYKDAANQEIKKINEKLAAEGKELLKDDNGSPLAF